MSGIAEEDTIVSLERRVDSLTEEVVRSYEELNLLYELGDALSLAMNLEEISSLIIKMAWDVTGAASAVLMLHDGSELVLKKHLGPDDDPSKWGKDLPLRVFESRTGLVLDSLSDAISLDIKDGAYNNSLCVPIKSHEKGLGILMLMDKEGTSFTSMDLKLVNAIASQTALYMEGYLLHEMKMEEKLHEAEALYEQEIESIAEKFDFDDEMIEGFVADCMEPMADVDQQILSLEKGDGNNDVIDSLFRTMHTIKGTAKFFDFKNIAELAHAMEDVFGLLRDNKLSPAEHVIDALMEGVEGLNLILEEIRKNKSEKGMNFTGLIGRMKNLNETKAVPVKEVGPPKEEAKDLGKVRDKSRISDLAVRVPIEKLNRLTGLIQRMNNLAVGYMTDVKGRMEEGEFGENGNREGGNLGLLLSQVDKMYGDSQSQIMGLRNVPIKNLFSRYPKMVRDLSRQTGKSIKLLMSGEEVEIDRTILDEISGPMVHIVRNSVDHGIERPEERARAGKPEEGTVNIKGRQEGSEIIIVVEDDGKGLDPEKLKAKAIDSGIISDADAASLPDSEAFQLIFMPGFSTSEMVTDISGRGVGMNVVKEVTAKLNGHVDISSKLGKGTTFTIKIPSTAGITSAVLVNVGKVTFAIPSAIVDEVTNIRSDDMYVINNREVINYRDSVIPIVALAPILKVASHDDEEKRSKYPVLIVEAEKGKMGLLVDRVIERTEVMVSPFRGIMMDSVFVSGATFIGNKLIPILDINGIMAERKTRGDGDGTEIISYSGDGYDLGSEREFIVFELAGEPYGVAFGHLQEIIRNEVEPVGIPGMGDALVGIINLRNSIVPLLDLKIVGLGVDDKERQSSKSRVLIVGAEDNSLGLLVDGVKEVCRVDDDDMEEVDAGGILNREFFPFMARAGDEIIKIVDIDKVVNYYRRGENVQ